MRNTYTKLVDEVVQKVGAALPPAPPAYLPDHRPDAVRAAADKWVPFGPDRLAEIDAYLTTLGDALFLIWSNQDYTDEAKVTQAATAEAAAREQVPAMSREVLARANTVLSGLRSASYPSRPQPRDAAQEAALANAKADVQMVLGPIDDPMGAVTRMSELLGRAMTAGDDLTTWLLASSTWPGDYLDSRGMHDYSMAWDAEVAQVLDQATPGPLAEVRRTYRIVSNPRAGLPALELLLGSVMDQILVDITAWRPVPAAH
jgi:hypothetical protein